jgi:hypothetical protein
MSYYTIFRTYLLMTGNRLVQSKISISLPDFSHKL